MDLITVKFYLTPNNYEHLWTASAFQGESMTDTLNRAVAFYDEVHQMKAPEVTGRLLRRIRTHTMSWVDSDGNRRRIARID